MSEYSDLIKDIVKKEKESDIYDIKICGIPIWRIFRSKILDRYLARNSIGFSRDTKSKKYKFIFFRSYLISIKDFFSIRKYKNVKNLIYAFPRLQIQEDTYFDKITDPLIEYSNIGNNYLIFQRPLAGIHKSPRVNSEYLVKTDFVEYTSILVGLLISPLVLIRYYKKIMRLCIRSKEIFTSEHKYFLRISIKLSSFFINCFFNYVILKYLKPQKVFFVNRELNYPVIVSSKKLGIKTFELQHGITINCTILYSGKYDSKIDPDYFLLFGEIWRGKQFGISINKQIVIGWAYKKMLENKKEVMPINEHSILVISEPVISEYVICTVVKMAQYNKEIIFDIRLHPQEQLTSNQMSKLEEYDNIRVVDNRIESSIAILTYQYVIGVNSTVLYEAFSLGRNVGLMDLNKNIITDKYNGHFYLIRQPDDVKEFLMLKKSNIKLNQKLYYEDFSPNIVNNL